MTTAEGRQTLLRPSAAHYTLFLVDMSGHQVFADNTEEAKPDIWKKADAFKELAERLQTQTDKLAAVAKDGDASAVKAAFGDVAKTCKECHDAFRTKHE